MSRYNLKFKKVNQDDDSVIYEVLTCDFNDIGESQCIGVLSFHDENFSFTPLGVWEGVEVVPLSIFSMVEAERKKTIKEQFSGALYTDWMYRIFKRAQVIKYEKKRITRT